MTKRITLLLGLAFFFSCANPLSAAPTLRSLIPFGKRVDADPASRYELHDGHGPWMILATTFSTAGSAEDAEKQAHELVLELRRRHNLEAYMHRRTFDFTKPVTGLGLNKFGEPRQMRYRQNTKFDEIAVLVGNYDSPESAEAQDALEKLKHLRPKALELPTRTDLTKGATTYQRFAGLREIQRLISPDPEKQQMGPMRMAFVTRNPLLPQEFFVPGGLSPIVLEMNKDVEFSLLDCPGRYSVRIASFRGESTMRLDEMDDIEMKLTPWRREPTKLEQAADKAHRLTVMLRQKGVEAYEFHDEFESVVTVGSFQSVGAPRPDGKIEIDPAIHSIVESYRARKHVLGEVAGLEPVRIGDIACDIQPVPVAVPKMSMAQNISRR